MDGSLLRFYVHENDQVRGQPAWEWLLRQANERGVRGGSALRAMAGFGRDRVLHEERFFELAGTVTVEVEFIVTDDEARQLLDLVTGAGLRAFYVRTAAHFGICGEKEKGRL
jgi:PII-like signaling protein